MSSAQNTFAISTIRSNQHSVLKSFFSKVLFCIINVINETYIVGNRSIFTDLKCSLSTC